MPRGSLYECISRDRDGYLKWHKRSGWYPCQLPEQQPCSVSSELGRSCVLAGSATCEASSCCLSPSTSSTHQHSSIHHLLHKFKSLESYKGLVPFASTSHCCSRSSSWLRMRTYNDSQCGLSCLQGACDCGGHCARFVVYACARLFTPGMGLAHMEQQHASSLHTCTSAYRPLLS